MFCPTCQRRLAHNARYCPTCRHDFVADREEQARKQVLGVIVLLAALAAATFVMLLPGIVVNTLRGRYRNRTRGLIFSAIRDWQTWIISLPVAVAVFAIFAASGVFDTPPDTKRAQIASRQSEIESSIDAITPEPQVRRAIAVSTPPYLTPFRESARNPASGNTFYSVAGIARGDTLNVRTGPGANNEVAGRLPDGYQNIRITGPSVMNGPTEWVPINYGAGNGWVTKQYLQVQ